MILDKIVKDTKERVERSKRNNPIPIYIQEKLLIQGKDSIYPFETALRKESVNFICEVKKASPSKGIISEDFPYLEIAKDYEVSGADAISVLTEPSYFLGSLDYLKEIKQVVDIPLLRKDFIVDEYQIYEAKIYGADAILLIVSILTEKQLKDYLSLAKSLGLSVLVEAHTKEEIEKALSNGANMIGVNNRNLKDFSMNLFNSIELRKYVPKDCIFVSESGVSSADAIKICRENHVNAVLVGEYLMKAKNRRETLLELRKGSK